MTNAIEASGLSKRYGKTWALHDCSFSLPAGRVAALATDCAAVPRRSS